MSLATRRQIEMPDSWQVDDGDQAEEKKVRYPRKLAVAAARELVQVLAAHCVEDRIRVCGSLRRGKAEVGDVEIVFVPRVRVISAAQRDFFGEVISPEVTELEAHAALDCLVAGGALTKRQKKDGTCTWGQWNRLAVHVGTGVPVDFFACTEDAFWNIVVCRTGGARTNVRIASAALTKGWRWEPKPDAPGFRRQVGLNFERRAVGCERDVFDFVGLPFKEPKERD
jgi:DNA polymerase/3'-5' exonuclease PolX